MQNAICSKCLKINTDTKFKTCLPCREAQREVSRRFLKRKKKKSIKLKEVLLNENFDVDICGKCGELKKDIQYKNCLKCRETQNEATKRWTEKNKRPAPKKIYPEKYCSICREKKDDLNFKLCSNCREKQREANRKFQKEHPGYSKQYYHKMFFIKRDEEDAIIQEFLENIH